MNKSLCHSAGTTILCTNGHKIAEVVEDLYLGDHPYSHKIGNYEADQEIPTVGDPFPIICKCGASWMRTHRFINTEPETIY